MATTAGAHERSPSDTSLSSCRSSLTPSPPRAAIQLHQQQSVQNNELVAAGDIREVGGGEKRRTTSGRMSGGGLKKLALGFRLFGLAFSLVSLSLMAADRNMGWALDSFNRYIEFRYCMMVNVIGFAYSALQGLNLAYQLSFGKYISESHVCCLIDFAFDQMLAYLLISSSSTAAIRVDDWRSNWGKDKFPDMASASVTVSFMSFVSFASSSLISGYSLYALYN